MVFWQAVWLVDEIIVDLRVLCSLLLIFLFIQNTIYTLYVCSYIHILDQLLLVLTDFVFSDTIN